MLAGTLVAGCGAGSEWSGSARTTVASTPSPSIDGGPTATTASATAPPATASASAARASLGPSSPAPGAEWVPGTHVSMVPPPGFEPTSDRAGYRDPTSDAVITVQEVPGGPFDVSDAAFEQSGLVVRDRERSTVDGQSRLVVQGIQTLEDGTSADAILVSLGTPTMSSIVFATVPPDHDDVLAAVLASLQTTRMDPSRQIEPGLAIAFDITPAPPLRLAGMLGQGATYNPLGRPDHPPSADVPTLQAYVVPEPVPADLAAYLHGQLDQNGQQLLSPTVQLEAGVEVDGVDAFWVVADAIDALQAADRHVFAYQLLVPHPDGDRFAYLVGIATRAAQDELLPAFRDTALSFRWRDPP